MSIVYVQEKQIYEKRIVPKRCLLILAELLKFVLIQMSQAAEGLPPAFRGEHDAVFTIPARVG